MRRKTVLRVCFIRFWGIYMELFIYLFIHPTFAMFTVFKYSGKDLRLPMWLTCLPPHPPWKPRTPERIGTFKFLFLAAKILGHAKTIFATDTKGSWLWPMVL